MRGIVRPLTLLVDDVGVGAFGKTSFPFSKCLTFGIGGFPLGTRFPFSSTASSRNAGRIKRSIRAMRPDVASWSGQQCPETAFQWGRLTSKSHLRERPACRKLESFGLS